MNQILLWIGVLITFYINLSASQTNKSDLLDDKTVSNIPIIIGFKNKNIRWSSDKLSIAEIPSKVETQFEIYGLYLTKIEFIAFSVAPSNWSDDCDTKRETAAYKVNHTNDHIASITIKIDHVSKEDTRFYFCSKIKTNSSSKHIWIYQGSDSRLTFRMYEKTSILPLWLQISIIIILFLFSGLFSGLNIGLMALNITELKIIEKAGSSDERSYAKTIRPIRKRGNFLLCSLLLGNVLVNNTLAILMDDLTGSGLMAVIFSTLGIVIFGEIIPQAICARHGLCIGAKTIWITKFFMVVTGFASYPISKLLDFILGKELGQVYSRAKLEMLVKEQQLIGSVVKDEALIIAGALTLTTKIVRDIMTPLSDVFMISVSSVLDFDTMNEIVRNGFTRVPIYEGERSNIKAVLNVKDLAFIDPDDKIPVSTVCTFYNRSILIVQDNTNLRVMLNDFRQGKAHMAFVERLENQCDGDPYHVMIGLVTLEDVIEEIIQAEIMDETDVFTDNVKKQRRYLRNQDFSVFNIPETGKYPRLSPQLKVAALRHLASNVNFFSEHYITINVLQSLLNANIVVDHTLKSGPNVSENIIYNKDKEANYAILILQGKANCEVSAENLLFEAGPFVLFGESLFKKVLDNIKDIEPMFISQQDVGTVISKLTRNCFFVPDFTLTAVTNLQYLKITANHYLFARVLSMWQNSGITEFSSIKNNPDQLNSSLVSSNIMYLSNENIANMVSRNKKSLTTNSLQLMRDFYQREWEKYMEPNESGDTSSNPNMQSCDETSPLVDISKIDTQNVKIFMAGDKTVEDISNDKLSTSNPFLKVV